MIISVGSCNMEKSSNMNKIFDPEERRLKSLKEKKKAFKLKEKLVQEALKNVHSKPQNKKIIFDNDVSEEQVTQTQKKRNALFDNDSDDDMDYEGSFANTGKLKASKDISEERLKLQVRYGNDQRFILDERFDDADENRVQQEEEEQKELTVTEDAELDLTKEKDWQLNILEGVLGAPVAAKNDNATTFNKKNKMIRYDPMEKGHKEYEICVDQTIAKPKKKAKKSDAHETADDHITPIPISKEIYYSVSNKLTDSLKETGKFSLLNRFGKDKPEQNSRSVNVESIPEEKNKKFQFRLDSTNAFKYDSSDDDSDNAEAVKDKAQLGDIADKEDCGGNDFFKKCDTFFFSNNDPRFNDALKFFHPKTESNEDLKSLRHELKQIVRAKIRNNLKRSETWGRKHKIKK